VTAYRDPIVANALDLYLPELDADAGALFAAARADAAGMHTVRRRRQTIAALAFAVFLLLAGAAVAAQQLDLLPFLHSNDRNTARFTVSPSRTYRGAAALALTCPSARPGAFTCNVTGALPPGKRLYELGMRTDKVPLLTRQSLLDALDKAGAQGAGPAEIARVRADLDAVGDDFIRALAVVSRIETVAGGAGSSSSSGTERVPPPGVPTWAACRELTLTTYRCRPLAALTAVASGAPLYYLQPSKDWRTVHAPPAQRSNFDLLLERVLGRKPNAAEIHFFIDFATVGSTTGSSSGPTKSQGTPIGDSSPRATALLAPGSLGIRTRVVSAAAQPLPHHLPGGLTRSGTRLYRVVFDLLRAHGIYKAGPQVLFVYVDRRTPPGVWRVAWVSTKP
jgi:hypothetical protein